MTRRETEKYIGNMEAFKKLFKHPSIQLMSNWLRGHNENPFALAPVNRNAVNISEPGGAENIKIENVLKQLGEMI